MPHARSLRCLLATALLLAPGVARGDEYEEKIAAAAQRVEEAVQAGDAAALKTLALEDDPDPWFVADALLARGAGGAAVRFAAAAPRHDVERLPEYVATAPGGSGEAARRKLYASVQEALLAKDPARALELLGGAAQGPDSVTSVRLLFSRVHAFRNLKRLREAADACEVAGQASLRLGWESHAGYAFDEGRRLCWRIPDLKRALDFAERTLAVQRRRGHEALTTNALVHVGSVRDAIGEHGQALEAMEQARARYEAAGDRVGLGKVVGNLGVIRWNLGELEAALKLQEQALVLAEEVKDPAQVARTQHRLGILLRARGDLARALELHCKASEQLGHLGHGGEAAFSLVAASNIHRLQGDDVRGLWTLERALAVARQVAEGMAEARALFNLGELRIALGDVEPGRRLQEQALAIWEKGGDKRSTVRAMIALCRTHLKERRPERAIPYINRALFLAKELRNPALITRAEAAHADVLIAVGRPDAALTVAESAARRADEQGDLETSVTAWQALGDVRHGRVEPALALPALRRAADGARRLRRTGSLVVALAGEARALRATGDPAGTMAVAREVAAELEGLGRGNDEESAASTRSRGLGALEEGALAAQTLGDGDSAVFFLEAGRAGALREGLGAGDLLRAEDLPEGVRAEEEAARAAEAAALARFSRALEDRASDLEARGKALDAAREQRRAAARRIQRWAKSRGSGAAPAVATREEIQRALAPGDVLVLYGWFGSHVMAAVVRPESVRIVTVGYRTPTEQAVDAALPTTNDTVPPEAVAAARKAVLGALELTGEDRRILVSPDGPLDRVPWALLEEEREVVLVPSGSVLGLLRARAEVRGSGVLALGDPAYGGDAGAGLGLGLPRLPASGDEARAVGDVVLLGAEASEPGLKHALATRPRWRAVHLACHGLIDADRPLLSCLALAPSADDDGLLTGHEILRLSVPADLVVLSGCETAKGKAFRGEGVLGLSRAFLLAGSSRVLASLWKVDDEATRAFMETLYAGWKQGDRLDAALNRARARLKAEPRWSHPRHWAAFVLWGLPD